jgi:hypothetical protein
MGLSLFISTISGYNALLALLSILLSLAKRPIENESEGGNRERGGVGGRPTTMTLHFPFLSLLSLFYFYSIFFLTFIFVLFNFTIALLYIACLTFVG